MNILFTPLIHKYINTCQWQTVHCIGADCAEEIHSQQYAEQTQPAHVQEHFKYTHIVSWVQNMKPGLRKGSPHPKRVTQMISTLSAVGGWIHTSSQALTVRGELLAWNTLPDVGIHHLLYLFWEFSGAGKRRIVLPISSTAGPDASHPCRRWFWYCAHESGKCECILTKVLIVQ